MTLRLIAMLFVYVELLVLPVEMAADVGGFCGHHQAQVHRPHKHIYTIEIQSTARGPNNWWCPRALNCGTGRVKVSRRYMEPYSPHVVFDAAGAADAIDYKYTKTTTTTTTTVRTYVLWGAGVLGGKSAVAVRSRRTSMSVWSSVKLYFDGQSVFPPILLVLLQTIIRCSVSGALSVAGWLAG